MKETWGDRAVAARFLKQKQPAYGQTIVRKIAVKILAAQAAVCLVENEVAVAELQ